MTVPAIALRFHRRVGSLLVAVVLTTLAAAGIPRVAHGQSEPPARPRLDSAADTNDWEAYYVAGMRALQRSEAFGEPYFYWAARLDPGRAEAHFGRWVAFWRRERGLWERYAARDREFLASPTVARVDSFRLRALHLNPFVHQGAVVLLYAELDGEWRRDPRTMAWLRYAAGDYRKAVEILGKAIARRPAQRSTLGYNRALAFVALGELDSAEVEISALLSALRARDSATVIGYESKEILEYGVGLLRAAKRDEAGAREAFERALVESYTFAPAHVALGRLALLRGDTATALRERSQAVELVPDNGYFRQQYGSVLLVAGRAAEALEQFRRAVALEPYFADSYYGLAAAHDLAGDAPAAARGYREYLTRAPRRTSSIRQHAERRLAALAAEGMNDRPDGDRWR